MWGTQAPKTGQAYAQMITYVGASASNFREYIQAPLTTPLVAGTSYQVSFWVSRGDNTQWACADIGAYLSVGPVGPVASFNPLPFTPQIQNTSGILTDATNWVQIQGTFVAAGGESHIVIGNFLGASASTATQVQTTGHNNAGYYIDDVSVTPLTGPLVSQHHLIGFADLPSPAPTGFIDMQMMSPNCPRPSRSARRASPSRPTRLGRAARPTIRATRLSGSATAPFSRSTTPRPPRTAKHAARSPRPPSRTIRRSSRDSRSRIVARCSINSRARRARSNSPATTSREPRPSASAPTRSAATRCRSRRSRRRSPMTNSATCSTSTSP
jgi:hypothetical protein